MALFFFFISVVTRTRVSAFLFLPTMTVLSTSKPKLVTRLKMSAPPPPPTSDAPQDKMWSSVFSGKGKPTGKEKGKANEDGDVQSWSQRVSGLGTSAAAQGYHSTPKPISLTNTDTNTHITTLIVILFSSRTCKDKAITAMRFPYRED